MKTISPALAHMNAVAAKIKQQNAEHSLDWGSESRAIQAAEGHRERGKVAVVVGNDDIGFFVFSWAAA